MKPPCTSHCIAYKPPYPTHSKYSSLICKPLLSNLHDLSFFDIAISQCAELPADTSILNPTPKTNPNSLTTSHPYQLVHHPAYLFP